MKYRPEFPDRFGGFDDALSFCRRFLRWYNEEHYHSGIGLLTPAIVHDGQAAEMIQSRQQVLESAYAAHPERFVRGIPSPPRQPTAVWINPPNDEPTGPGAHEKGLPEIQPPRKPEAPLAHPRPGYPSSGCVPAEPDSVSPDGTELNDSIVPGQPPLDTRVMRTYRHRWTGTETYHRDGKQQHDMGDGQLRDGQDQTRHVYLVMLAYSLLTHQRQQARARVGPLSAEDHR